ncbi:phosphorus acquisition-controlling protein [Nannizzia gypsea CBS 118893]|uniref:Phosphorus acquisition-controlling protein n=1 Tax=Arthroderma gypseum (strain ATCC MYA-4604 / CBS 118893) TaxID=535722 RepID=E4UPJ2_ARTGP|nr:phosphorus acquisition-controlling protein [Nannizzia gypsea CBS 118893]EFQ99867.1 phosphorus acquisition-controlling protein [Nannizzia gypsea CBS 118893]
MNQDPSLPSWPEHVPDETTAAMIPTTTDDYTSLLDFNFDLAEFDSGNAGERQNQNMVTTAPPLVPTTGMQDISGLTSMEHIATSQPLRDQQQHYPASVTMAGSEPVTPMEIQTSNSMPQQQHYYMKQQQQSQNAYCSSYGQRHSFVPPTPDSADMHGGPHNYNLRLETGHQRGYEPFTRGLEDQSSFTPLMSPAMTPLEHQLRFPEYTTPGEYLSPLTSPALEARQSSGAGFNFPSGSHMDYSSMLSSPTEISHQHPATTGPLTNSPKLIQKQRRKSQASRLSRQSPLVRPQNGRSRPQTEAEARARAKKLSAQAAANRTSNSRNSSSNEGSGLDSVSPEPLTEPLMPPPALPRSGKSPYMAAQDHPATMSEVATPATLMKLQKQQISPGMDGEFSRNGTVVIASAPEEHMEDISLPEPVSLQGALSGESTPTIHAKPSQILKPRTESISELKGTNSVNPSPVIKAKGSPSGPVGLKRSDSKQSSRVTKKRQGMSAAQSPALRPKISPSIQPLIRADGVSSETSALHLASKSNYQHILEGTLLPGVTYPEALAENLSSKRTNHKLAEQGRRNRINSALKEIESLLPTSLTHKAKEKEQNKDSADSNSTGVSKVPDKPPTNQPISKASTVEMAIVYIKALKQELEDTKAKLKAAESKSCNDPPSQISAPAPVPAPSSEPNSLQISAAQIEKQDTISGVSAANTTTESK